MSDSFQKKRRGHRIDCLIAHTNLYKSYAGGKYWVQQGSEDYLQIDLGAPQHVTHIGVMGEIPALATFPPKELYDIERKKPRGRQPLLTEHGN